MSDDTPTQRLPEAGSDAPTKRLDTAPGGELAEERKKSKTLLAVLLSVGGALLIAIIVLLIILLTGGGTPSPGPTPSDSISASPSPTPSESPTPSPSPTPTESEDPEPPPPPPPSAIVSYTVTTTTVDCSGVDSVPLTFNWNTTGQSVSFGIATDFADSQPFQTDLPAVGGITVNYQCSNESTKFAIAVFHNGDVLERETIIVRK